MRALVVTNMWPSSADPARGAFVRDQVRALRELDGVEVGVYCFAAGGARSYVHAARDLRSQYRNDPHDVIHAHFGLTAGPALALRNAPHAVTLHGTDVRHPRSGRVTRALLPQLDLIATVSAPLAAELGSRRPVTVLPCGVAMDRFRPIARAEARERLGLDPHEPCLLFPADPQRRGKRHDLAIEVANGARLLSLGGIEPSDVPLWINAANAVVLPSDAEGFGLAVLEALACDVPVICTPVGIHPTALRDLPGTLCAPYDRDSWREAAAHHLAAADPRVDGRPRAELWSAQRMARRVHAAWSELSGPQLYSASAGLLSGARLS
jgi:glycosyltransferase involved in cell wall biosynthesis